MVPLTGAKPLRRVSRVCEVLTRASATRSADTAESRLAFAHIQLDHAAGFVGADEDHVGLDPALIAGIPALGAAGEHCRQRKRRQNSHCCSRRGHVVLRSPKIRSRWTRNISVASSGACRLNRLCQMTATIAGAIIS